MGGADDVRPPHALVLGNAQQLRGLRQPLPQRGVARFGGLLEQCKQRAHHEQPRVERRMAVAVVRLP
eukprot:7385371-Prymnesium_polylepis.1